MRVVKKQKYPQPRVVAVDVDGTLFIRGEVNKKLVEWCKQKKHEGFVMVLWSSRGEKHAKRAAEISELTDCFDMIMSKPGYIVDDKGWTWIKYTKVVTCFDT